MGAGALDDLDNRRSDIFPKMSGMIKRNISFEASNAACHICGGRFSMRFEVEAKGRSDQASVFRFTMACSHCSWNGAFYGYLHEDGRNGLTGQPLAADRFFADTQ